MLHRAGFTAPLRRVFLWALPVGGYSVLAVLKRYPPFSYVPDTPAGLDAALTFAMALLIAFRINRAYERWWEARTLWGKLVNVSRNLAVKVRCLQRATEDDYQSVQNLLVGFCVGLKDHLRGDPDMTRLPGIAADQGPPAHLPGFVVSRLYALFGRWREDGRLSDGQMWVLDTEARELLEVSGGCERIKMTLMSVSWRTFTLQCIAVYLLVLPWGLVDDFGPWTVPMTTLIAYFVMAGEGIAHYVEEPFGAGEDRLDLEGICEVIDRSVGAILSDERTRRQTRGINKQHSPV